jgi:Tol biopolymer transport system component
MTGQTSELQPKKKVNGLGHSDTAIVRVILFVAMVLVLVSCSSHASAPDEVRVQAALPTPTLEPTFTPVPPPTSTPQPSPTATPAEPTPTPTPQSLLSGRILDEGTNQPIAGAKVSVGTATAATDAEGRYTLTGLPPGQYVLSITHPGYDPGLSSIFTLAAGQEQSLDLTLYAPDTSPYPKDPMLTNPLDPNGAPTIEDAERLARLQGLTGEVVNIRETTLSGEYLVNYKIGDEVRASVAELNHDVWELTDDADRKWWIIKVCGNLASPLPTQVAVATPQPRPLPPMAEVLVDGLIVRECALQECAEAGTIQKGARIEVLGCLADGSWCQVGLPEGGSGWCKGQSLQHLAVMGVVPVVRTVLPTETAVTSVSTGGRVAFVSDRDGNYEIYTMSTDGRHLARLTNHSASDIDPAWSPDGQRIAFVSKRDGNDEIYVMNADGSNLKRLTNFPGKDLSPSWSPDGNQIAFHSDRDEPNLNSCNQACNWDIYVMNADGTDVTRLTDHPALDTDPAWSPDGQQIVFDSYRTGNSEIFIMNTDGNDLSKLIPNGVRSWNPAWSPDGQKIAFVSDYEGNWDIYVINVDGNGLTRLTNHPSLDAHPTWSPDSQQIIFKSYRDGDPNNFDFNMEIYLMGIDGSNLTRLTNHPAVDANPAWSP